MASTAWTATRADLVKALAAARGQAQAHATRAAELEAKEQARKARRREADRRYIERCRAQAPSNWTPPAPLHIEPDPNAAQHRADLLAALKEKP